MRKGIDTELPLLSRKLIEKLAGKRSVLTTENPVPRSPHPCSKTPLMWLPDNEARAIEIVKLLLAHGAATRPSAISRE
ncbi:MAG TPA: hypothetical protein VGL91_00130 [Acidobacteriota bacterium]